MSSLLHLAGIAPNMMLAKVCSDKNKPNGQYRLPATREAVMDFIQKLPVRKVKHKSLKGFWQHMQEETLSALIPHQLMWGHCDFVIHTSFTLYEINGPSLSVLYMRQMQRHFWHCLLTAYISFSRQDTKMKCLVFSSLDARPVVLKLLVDIVLKLLVDIV